MTSQYSSQPLAKQLADAEQEVVKELVECQVSC